MTAIANKLKARKLSARIGAEISGLDISRPLDEQTLRSVREALNEHKALVFRTLNSTTTPSSVSPPSSAPSPKHTRP
jgi:alpha-ketoglutarate-dependent taurine dioxygenase